VTVSLAAKRRVYRTASFVTQDENQLHTQVLDRILQAAKADIVDDVARGPNNEKVAVTPVENKFGRYPRVGARNDRRDRVLLLRNLVTPFGGTVNRCRPRSIRFQQHR
jgi:hypothetical protein